MNQPAWTTVRSAWRQALYGEGGFYRSERPVDHFRTSVHASALFAGALVALARRHGLGAVTDVGAGDGELLTQLHSLAPDLSLTGVELRPRPESLPPDVAWRTAMGPTSGLVVANELLDNVPVDVVELDADGVVRLVEVDSATGEQRLGRPAPPDACDWLATWWVLRRPGDRAEIGLVRDALWARLCGRVRDGVCLAIDFGHTREDRPATDTVASYRSGRRRPLSFDGRHDVTSAVALDSVAAAVGAGLQSQGEALAHLGVPGRRPLLSQSASDPAGYVRALARASQASELTSTDGGLGSFGWLSCVRRPPTPATSASSPG